LTASSHEKLILQLHQIHILTESHGPFHKLE